MENYNKIYNWLEDEISKQLYVNRINYYLTKDYKYIENSVDELSEFKNFYKNHQPERVMIYGAGIYGQFL